MRNNSTILSQFLMQSSVWFLMYIIAWTTYLHHLPQLSLIVAIPSLVALMVLASLDIPRSNKYLVSSLVAVLVGYMMGSSPWMRQDYLNYTFWPLMIFSLASSLGYGAYFTVFNHGTMRQMMLVVLVMVVSVLSFTMLYTV